MPEATELDWGKVLEYSLSGFIAFALLRTIPPILRLRWRFGWYRIDDDR